MPPKRGADTARKRENMYFEPGVRGRKTGLTVPDTGIRDEMGMEPIDDLFSSPEKTLVMGPPAQPTIAAAQSARKRPTSTPKVAAPKPSPAPVTQQMQQMHPLTLQAQKTVQNGTSTTRSTKLASTDETNSHDASASMDINNSTMPEPTAVLTARRKSKTNSYDASASMDIGNSTMPEPTAVLTARRESMHAPLPKSNSPKKTFLGSPARRHAGIQLGESSPTRGTIMNSPKKTEMEKEKEPVARKLNFSNGDGDDVFAPTRLEAPTQMQMQPIPKSPAPAAASPTPIIRTPAAANGKRKRASASLEKENQVALAPEDIPAPDSVRSIPGAWEEATPFPSQKKSDRSFDLSPENRDEAEWQPQMDEDDDGDEQDFEQLLERTATPPEGEPEPGSAKAMAVVIKKRGRMSAEKVGDVDKEEGSSKGKGKEVAVTVAVAEKKKSGRPKSKEKEKERQAVIPMAQAEQYLSIEASRIYSDDESPALALPPPKRSKLSSKDVNRKISIQRAAQLAKDVESSPVQIQRGPPRPRQQGLFITRRETPAIGPFATARAGMGGRGGMLMGKKRDGGGLEDGYANEQSYMVPPANQPIYRDEADLHSSPGTATKPSKSHQQDTEAEEEDLAEPWESAPGRISGPIKEWSSTSSNQPSDPAERDDEIAFSSRAIITRPIPGSSVQFAKTLTLPFFGSGMVDLPPGAVKRPKNSRKMQMVFFVYKGRVKVTVNGTSFGIGEGGCWQVPRGNSYAIENEGGKEARIFFSQGCEVAKEE